MKDLKALIEKIVTAYGPTGSENHVAELITKEIEPYVDSIRIDPLGNLIAVKKAEGPKVMLAAHMDEIGIMVTHIDDKGFLRFAPLGGINPNVLLGTRCVFANGTRGVYGSERLNPGESLTLAKMYIDIGAKDKEDAAQKVKIGDSAGADYPMVDLGDRLVSKAMDDRIACVILIETIKQLKNPKVESHFVFTVQEEVGLRGARTSAYSVDPDYGIAIDVTRTGDTPKGITMDVSLGEGPTVKVRDSSILCHPKMIAFMKEVAEKEEIPYQLEILEAGGTDSGAIHLTRSGVPSGVMSIACRYIHTPSEMIDINDVTNGIKLMTKILESEFPKI
ncbi:MAG: M42 family metallopeptidase [Firmicutes bacterium]|nr:M42 family metallopeptidase [Bacillota bacterium]